MIVTKHAFRGNQSGRHSELESRITGEKSFLFSFVLALSEKMGAKCSLVNHHRHSPPPATPLHLPFPFPPRRRPR
jgi:hypothetical protein